MECVIGLDELIASTVSEYESLAIELATQPARLAAVRQRIDDARKRPSRERPLFDSAQYVRWFESALEQAALQRAAAADEAEWHAQTEAIVVPLVE